MNKRPRKTVNLISSTDSIKSKYKKVCTFWLCGFCYLAIVSQQYSLLALYEKWFQNYKKVVSYLRSKMQNSFICYALLTSMLCLENLVTCFVCSAKIRHNNVC